MSETPDASVPTPPPATPVQPAAPVVLPPENRTRGTLLALLIIPAGIIVWAIIWSIGFIAGIVGIGVAIGALALYRFGSGGRISLNGAVRVSVIVVITLVLAFFAGIIADDPSYFSRAMQNGVLIQGLGAALNRYETGSLVINVLLLLVFTVLGVVTVVRTALTQSKQQAAAEAASGTAV